MPRERERDSHSVREVESVWIWSECLAEDSRVVGLLEHVEVDSLLVLEADALGLCVCVE